MRHTTRQTREHRTITVDFRSEATSFQWLGEGKAFLECVLAFVLALGVQLPHTDSTGLRGEMLCGAVCSVISDPLQKGSP
jgi:hypothetical protein